MRANPRYINAGFPEPVVQVVSVNRRAHIETQIRAVASYVLNPVVVACDIIKFDFEEAARVMHKLQQVSVLNLLPRDSEVNQVHKVHILVVRAAHWVDSEVLSAVEAAKTRVATESHNVSASAIVLIQVPVLMRPHLGRPANSDGRFVNNEWNPLFGGQLSQSLVIGWRCLVVSQACDRLDNDCTDVLSSCPLLLDNLGSSLDAPLFLVSVCFSILDEGLHHVWERSTWPLVCWNTIAEVNIRAAECGD